jgi:hypothetical protein
VRYFVKNTSNIFPSETQEISHQWQCMPNIETFLTRQSGNSLWKAIELHTFPLCGEFILAPPSRCKLQCRDIRYRVHYEWKSFVGCSLLCHARRLSFACVQLCHIKLAPSMLLMWATRNMVCFILKLSRCTAYCWNYIVLLRELYSFICSLFYDTFRLLRIYWVEWKGDKWMLNWKGFGRKRSWPN